MTHCTYEILENDIHKFALVKADRKAMQEFIAYANDLFANHPRDQMLYMLIDFRPAGVPPLAYAVRSLRSDLLSKHDEIPTIRAAYLHNRSTLASLISTFLETLRIGTTRKLFEGDHEDEAIAWLLEE